MFEIESYTKCNKFLTVSDKQVEKINSRLPEYYRTYNIIGHSTSQTSYSLQTMQMISDSPLSRMKQCLAQINRKYNALQEAFYKIENKKYIPTNNKYTPSKKTNSFKADIKPVKEKKVEINFKDEDFPPL